MLKIPLKSDGVFDHHNGDFPQRVGLNYSARSSVIEPRAHIKRLQENVDWEMVYWIIFVGESNKNHQQLVFRRYYRLSLLDCPSPSIFVSVDLLYILWLLAIRQRTWLVLSVECTRRSLLHNLKLNERVDAHFPKRRCWSCGKKCAKFSSQELIVARLMQQRRAVIAASGGITQFCVAVTFAANKVIASRFMIHGER